jgi:hypothetical protein
LVRSFIGKTGASMTLLQQFTRHPAAVGETYGQHLAFATGTGGRMVIAGLACIVHGIFPFLFERTGSRTILELHRSVTQGRRGAIAAGVTPVAVGD